MPIPEYTVPAAFQPKVEDYPYALDSALASVVALRAKIPGDAFTAEILGTERAGHGVFIDDGLILTIGYLITEAEEIWLTLHDGRTAPGFVLAFDNETGFGLVQALAKVDVPSLPLGSSADVDLGERVVVGGAGREQSVAARIVAKQEFAGYWEYLLDEALFTAPAHPHWGGTALIGPGGELLGIGSLQLEAARGGNLNMIVPIDLLKPILDDLRKSGRANRPARPWLGFYASEMEERIVIVGVAAGAPASRAGLQPGDIVVAVRGQEVRTLASLWRAIRELGAAGVEVPLTLFRGGDMFDVSVRSGDRASFLKRPRIH